ncbi:MAG: hypothetical protein AVDCRST_MAG40-3195, partial [uncultured Gemmatimonadaceae bacterium]
ERTRRGANPAVAAAALGRARGGRRAAARAVRREPLVLARRGDAGAERRGPAGEPAARPPRLRPDGAPRLFARARGRGGGARPERARLPAGAARVLHRTAARGVAGGAAVRGAGGGAVRHGGRGALADPAPLLGGAQALRIGRARERAAGGARRLVPRRAQRPAAVAVAPRC